MNPDFVANLVRAPRLAALALGQSSHPVALTGAAVAAVDSGQFTSNEVANGRYFRVQADTAFVIAFGPAAMGNPVLTDDWLLQPNFVYDFWLGDPVNERFFSLNSAAAGVLRWYIG